MADAGLGSRPGSLLERDKAAYRREDCHGCCSQFHRHERTGAPRRSLLPRDVCVHCVTRADDYPSRVVKIVVPSGPAGGYDFVGRAVADQLTKRLGQSVIVREPLRRGHGCRHPVGDRGAGRRLHAAGGRPEQHHLQRKPLQEAALRCARAAHAGRHRLHQFVHPGCTEGFAVQRASKNLAPARRRRSGEMPARPSGRWHRPASRRRCIHEIYRHQVSRRCPIAGRRRSIPISDLGPRRSVLRFRRRARCRASRAARSRAWAC